MMCVQRNSQLLRLVGSAMLLVTSASGIVLGQSSTTNPYRATLGWEQLPEGRVMGTVSGVYPDPDGTHLWLLDR